MIDWVFQAFGFLSSNVGLLLTGAATALLVLLWDWRVALAGVFFVQLSAATSAVVLHGVPAQWALIQTVVVGMVCVMLTLSARAHRLRPSFRQTGTWISRGFLLGMFLAGAWFMNIQVTLPGMDPLVMELFLWLVLCGIMLLGLSEHPLYNAVGVLLWLIPVQVVVAVVTPIPALVALVGLVVLTVGMAVSYLVFVEHMPAEERGLVLTDLAFPQQVKLEHPPAPEAGDDPTVRVPDWVRRALPRTRLRPPPRHGGTKPAASTAEGGESPITAERGGEPPPIGAGDSLLARRRP
jgi:hypothetical protein